MGKLAIAKNGKVELPSGETIKVGSKQWFEWLEALDTKSFRVNSNDGNGYTCRKERANGYWYGYRKVEGKLRKRYMGKSTDLTRAQLNKIKELLRVPASPGLLKGVSEQPLDLNQELESQLGNLQAENLSLQSQLTELRSELAKRKSSYRDLTVELKRAHGHLLHADSVFPFKRFSKLSGLSEMCKRLEWLLQEIDRAEQNNLT